MSDAEWVQTIECLNEGMGFHPRTGLPGGPPFPDEVIEAGKQPPVAQVEALGKTEQHSDWRRVHGAKDDNLGHWLTDEELAVRDTTTAESAWDECAQALAWTLAAYVAAQNPYRKEKNSV